MISYNWDNQPIIKRIAQSLKDHGYNVWLDLEQMGGSTLEASITNLQLFFEKKNEIFDYFKWQKQWNNQR
jgi:hypothetical protein